MDVSRLMKPAEKQVSLKDFGDDGDFVTVRLIPGRVKYQIDVARAKGLNFKAVSEIAKKNPGIDWKDEKSVVNVIAENGNIIGEGFDNGFEANILTLMNGVDEKKHTFKNGEKAARLDRDFWEKLVDNPAASDMVACILKAVDDYQGEMRLGEPTARS